jgi:hypothetical protein
MAEMVLTSLGRKAHWQPEYIAYTVELQQQYDDGLISLAEVELRLQERFPLEPVPDERTRRRWAHEKYADLPERRRQVLGPQELSSIPQYASAIAAPQPALTPISWLLPGQAIPVQNGLTPVTMDLVNCMAVCAIAIMCGAISRLVITSL